MSALFWAFLTLAILGAYLLPAFIAVFRDHRNALAIGMLNILLGWCVLGWVAALVWSLTDNRKGA